MNPKQTPKMPNGVLTRTAIEGGDAPQIAGAGTVTMPAKSEAALGNVGIILRTAEENGVELPEIFEFLSGQIFYKNGQPEEVRLAIAIPADADADGKTWEVRTTPTAPQLDYRDGQLRRNPDDTNRRHLSAIITPNTNEADTANLVLFFDLRDEIATDAAIKTRKPVDETIADLPNSKADQDLHHGLMLLPTHWGLNENSVTRYHNGKHGHVVTYQPSEVEKALGDAPDRALNALEKRFKELRSEAVADVIDILFHHWQIYKDNQTNAVVINAAKLCEYRGKVPEGENLRIHWEALRDAFSLTLRDTKSDLNAKVFFAESQGENRDGPGARYTYSPGFMLQYALSGQPLYFAPFLQKMWALDPKLNNEAKRLARYLRADWRMNTEKYLTAESGGARAARWHSWAFLLAESGVDVETHRKSQNKNRLIETIGRAVETLYQMEVIAEGGFDIYHPDDRKTAENLPPRGALNAWLALRVCLAPSAKLREALLKTDGERRKGRARDAEALATERAKKQLRAEGKTKPKAPKG